MKCPAERVGDKLDHPRRADRHDHGRLRPARGLRHWPTVGFDDLERVPVEVDRVMAHRPEVAKPDPYELVVLCDERLGGRK